MRPERNDPCPCGSGRKYKRCHFNEENRERRVRHRLQEFSISSIPKKEFDRALLEFFGPREERALDESDGVLFAAYLIHDHRTEAGDTVFERFFREHAAALSEEDRTVLVNLAQARLGVYEVVETRPGIGVILEDVFTNDTFDVRDLSASRGLVRWQLVYGRIIPGRGAWVGDGALTGFEPQRRGEILHELERFGIRKGNPDTPEQFSRRGAEIHRALETLALKPPYESVVTLEGDPAAKCVVRYLSRDSEGLIKALERTPDVYPAGPDEDDRLFFNWAKPEDAIEKPEMRDIENGLCRVTYLVPASNKAKREARGRKLVNLATIAVGPGDVIVETMSERRLRAARRLLEGAVHGLKLEKETIEPIDLAKEWAECEEDTYRSHEVGEASGDVSPEEEERMRRKLAAEFLKTWPETPLKPLAGLSPRRAARVGKHRQELVSILKEMEYRAALGQGPLTPKDVTRLISELGLTWPPDKILKAVKSA